MSLCSGGRDVIKSGGKGRGRTQKFFKFLSKVQASLFNSVFLESMHLFHIKEKFCVKNRVGHLSYLQTSVGRSGLQQLLIEEF